MTIRLREHWRMSTFRLAFLFGVLFTIGNVALLSLIYIETSGYLVNRIDTSIVDMASNFRGLSPARVADEVHDAVAFDLRRSNLYGLFGADGSVVAGNMRSLPPNLKADGSIQQFAQPTLPAYRAAGQGNGEGLARALVQRLPNGNILIVGRDFTQLAEIRAIILNALLVSGAVILFAGLLSGFLLSRGPLRRISAIRATSRRIMQGELSQRMPVTSRNDELDMLATIVNTMLEEIERLLNEVKSVTDTLAHDLRTPLTRLRLQLHKLQQSVDMASHRETLDNALEDTDALLARFRALLRISEIENRQRKSGFRSISVDVVLNQLVDLFEPLAEEADVNLMLECHAVAPIDADPDLLFEALSNLVDNAIKFTPAGGSVWIRAGNVDGVVHIDIIDTGCGVPLTEREAVMLRFHRSQAAQPNLAAQPPREGFGLGLSIAAAVMRLHGFALRFQDTEQGTHLTIVCSGQIL